MARPRAFFIPILMLFTLPLPAQHERREREEGPRHELPREEHGRGRGRESREQAAPRRDMESPRSWAERPPERFERPGRPEGREERRDERPERGEPRAYRPPPPAQARPQGREAQPPPRATETARAWQARESWRRDAWAARPTWREHRARHWERDHRTWAQRGGYGGYLIPQPQFVSRFGVSHPFFLGSRPVIYQGYPRFRCGGYWFLIVDPWPEFWVDDWYLRDEVYIDYYGDGYYLVNPRYPGIRVAITVFL